MEWSTTSMNIPPWQLESNSFNPLNNFNYDLYEGNSSMPMVTQTGPVISIPEHENVMMDAYQCPSDNNEMVKKKKRLTNEQLASLEESFQDDIKLDTERKMKLSKELGLQPRQIAVWFQNRRSRWKVKYLEESYDSLRKEYKVVSKENQMLHEEVKKLRDIILKDHLMKEQSNFVNSNQITGGTQIGIDQYNNPMLVASTSFPAVSQPPYQW